MATFRDDKRPEMHLDTVVRLWFPDGISIKLTLPRVRVNLASLVHHPSRR